MSEKIDFAAVIADIERFLAMFPGLAAFAQDLGKISVLQQAANEAEARIVNANAQFSQQKEDHMQQLARQANLIEEARVKAAEANDDIAKLLQAAHDQAHQVVKEATTKAEQIAEQSARAAAASQDTLDKVNAMIAAARQEIAAVHAERGRATEDLEKVKTAFREARASLDELKARL